MSNVIFENKAIEEVKYASGAKKYFARVDSNFEHCERTATRTHYVRKYTVHYPYPNSHDFNFTSIRDNAHGFNHELEAISELEQCIKKEKSRIEISRTVKIL